MFNTEEIADCTVININMRCIEMLRNVSLGGQGEKININMRCIEIADWLRHTAGY